MHRVIEFLKRYPVAGVVLLGAVIRFIFLMEYLSSPEWDQLVVDSLFHDRWAQSIAAGNLFGREVFFRAPFYIYVLGGIYAVFGHSLLAARIFGHLVGLAAVLITYQLASRIFSKRVGIIAGLIHALYPIAIYFESELLVDSLFAMLMELTVLLLFIAFDKRSVKLYFLAGIVIGAAAVTRPIILALVPLYLIWLLIASKPFRTGLISGAVLTVSMLLMISPVTLRNLVTGHDFVLISSSGGINFYIGNNPEASGLAAALPGPYETGWEIRDAIYIAESETGRKLKASEVSEFFSRKAWDWIKANPTEFLRLYLKKIYFCFNNFEISNNRNLALVLDDFSILRLNFLNFAILLALAITAVIYLLFNRNFTKQIIFILLLSIGYLLTISLFFINARFRLPVLPVFFVLAGYGLERLYMLFRNREFRAASLAAVLGGIAAFILSHSNVYNVDKGYVSGGFYNKANYHFYHGDYGEAINLYHRVLEDDPYYPEANLNLGAVFLKKGMGDSAEFYFNRELENYPDNARAYSNLASLFYLRKDNNKAREYVEKALELRPYFADPYLISMRIYSDLGDSSSFERNLERARENLEDDARINLDAGLIYSQWQMYDRAIRCLRAALESQDLPIEINDKAFSYGEASRESIETIKARAAYQLGYIYGIQDRLDDSIEMSRTAISLDSNLAEAYINLANGYMIRGDRNEAREIINKARERFPDNVIISALFHKLK